MVEVLIPNSIVNRSMVVDLPMLDYNMGYPLEDAFATSVQDDNRALKERVQRQVEWYFSDENLRKDAFLMKHIARNKNGFVSLKLVASLRKIKSITKDSKVVADCIADSKYLVLNEDYTKVRRVDPVPDIDYSTIPKTIIITKYPIDNPNVSQIEQEYLKYGTISRITVLYPGKAVPLYVKSCKSRFQCIGTELCILVEYATTEMAKRAVKESKQSWRQAAIVQLLSQHQEELKPALDKKLQNRWSEDLRRKSSQSKNGYGSDSGLSGMSRSPSTSPKSSPAPIKRFFNDSTLSPIGYSRTSGLKAVKKPVAILRNPLGPDGTKGFKQLL